MQVVKSLPLRLSYRHNLQRLQLNTPQGVRQVNLPFAGEHNVQNATAAAAFALAIGISLDDIVLGLEQAVGAKGV